MRASTSRITFSLRRDVRYSLRREASPAGYTSDRTAACSTTHAKHTAVSHFGVRVGRALRTAVRIRVYVGSDIMQSSFRPASRRETLGRRSEGGRRDIENAVLTTATKGSSATKISRNLDRNIRVTVGFPLTMRNLPSSNRSQ